MSDTASTGIKFGTAALDDAVEGLERLADALGKVELAIASIGAATNGRVKIEVAGEIMSIKIGDETSVAA